MPCCSSKTISLLSLNGFEDFSASIRVFRIAQTAVDEHSPPEEVPTWLEKKYFSSKIPCGVARYFAVVTREMVDSCNSNLMAMSARTIGFIPIAP